MTLVPHLKPLNGFLEPWYHILETFELFSRTLVSRNLLNTEEEKGEEERARGREEEEKGGRGGRRKGRGYHILETFEVEPWYHIFEVFSLR